MDVFTKRNAVVGYATLKAASHYVERRRKARERAKARAEAEAKLRSAWKPALMVFVGIVSVGILAGVAYAWRKSAAQARELADVAEEVATEAEASVDVPSEDVASEPVPAT